MDRSTGVSLAVFLIGLASAAVIADEKTADSKDQSVGTPSIYEKSGPAPVAGEIDRLVFAELGKLGIEPVLCSDAVFVRRAYLDVIGTLPTAEEARDVHPGPGREEQAPSP